MNCVRTNPRTELSQCRTVSVLPNDDHVPETTPADDRARCKTIWGPLRSQELHKVRAQSLDFAISRCLGFRMTRTATAESYPLVRCGATTVHLCKQRPPPGTGVGVVPWAGVILESHRMFHDDSSTP